MGACVSLGAIIQSMKSDRGGFAFHCLWGPFLCVDELMHGKGKSNLKSIQHFMESFHSANLYTQGLNIVLGVPEAGGPFPDSVIAALARQVSTSHYPRTLVAMQPAECFLNVTAVS